MYFTDSLLLKHCKKALIPVVFFVFCLTGVAVPASALNLSNVNVVPRKLTPGETVGISFFISQRADVTIQIFTPDFDVVRHLTRNESRPGGVNTFKWDGRDDNGKQVPNEAYLVGIEAETSGGETVVYDPTTVSGGEYCDLHIQDVRQTDNIYSIAYSVSSPSRVDLKAGVRNGPMLKTLIDWQPKTAGVYTLSWNALDDTGRINVMDLTGAHLMLDGFALPENAIIVEGSSQNYLEYRKTLPRPEDSLLSYQSARQAILERQNQGISAQSLVQRALNTAPRFTVYLNTDDTTGLAEKSVQQVSGEIQLKAVISPESMDMLNEARFELIIFIDYRRFDEEEHAHTPYVYTLDTTSLSNGEHMITINLVGLTGQVGSYSFKVDVNN
ncbi:FlgD immunoglobulin-like domain containing protein [Desulfobacter latus]|uniref:FlgD/Vpr Ig-like domain-containing protein n=1 Tax=Desulfobacter latus TaxID=2292 RepID=A0A850SVM5_9BACT|nr:FlgD immunoglobulin-like domain containing protein [Desulfobacter latus]NWH05404.1 hypothetical protein [Desulfobacter latus]